MKRRTFIATSAAAVAAAPFSARAQERLPVVGWLGGSDEGTPDNFLLEMEELVYVRDLNFSLVARPHFGDASRLPTLAIDVVAAGPEVITVGDASALAAIVAATNRIPIVGWLTEDLANRFAGDRWEKPKGNITGMVSQLNGHAANQLQVLVNAIPEVQRIGLIGDAGSVASVVAELEAAAAVIGKEILPTPYNSAEDFRMALGRLTGENVDAVFATILAGARALSSELMAWAVAARVPVLYSSTRTTQVGGLMSFQLDVRSLRQTKTLYVVKILEGAVPADLPLGIPRAVLALNLNTARDLGIEFPPNIIALADVVIE